MTTVYVMLGLSLYDSRETYAYTIEVYDNDQSAQIAAADHHAWSHVYECEIESLYERASHDGMDAFLSEWEDDTFETWYERSKSHNEGDGS